MREAPLQVEALRLNQWLLQHFHHDSSLDRRILARSLDLLEHLTHALNGMDRALALEEADRCLASLRALLRLAHEVDRLTDRQVLHVHGELEPIGKQLGGWMRRLASGTLDERRR